MKLRRSFYVASWEQFNNPRVGCFVFCGFREISWIRQTSGGPLLITNQWNTHSRTIYTWDTTYWTSTTSWTAFLLELCAACIVGRFPLLEVCVCVRTGKVCVCADGEALWAGDSGWKSSLFRCKCSHSDSGTWRERASIKLSILNITIFAQFLTRPIF